MTALAGVILAKGWLFRKRDGDDDYGLDGDIEIFLDDESTGLEFPVQVKGTTKLNGRPKVRIEWATWEYWRDQANPVLVVLWERDTGKIWWEWVHRFDTTGINRQSKKFTFRFPDDQVWNAQTPFRLESEVRAWRAWSQSLAHLPMSIVVRSSGDVGGVSTVRIVGRLRQRLRQLPDVLELRRDHRGVLWLDVHIASSETAIWVSGGPSVVIHHDQAEAQPPDLEGHDAFIDLFTGDLLIGMARHLAGIGARTPGARVAEIAVEDASVVFEPQIALPVLDLLIESQRWDGVHRLLARILVGGDEVLMALVMRLLGDMRLDEDAQRRIAHTIRYCVHSLENGFGDSGRAARLSYNGSVVLRAGDPQPRLEFLNEAARLDPAYRQRAYWWRELGGCLFMLEDYPSAVEHYQEALNRGDAEVAPLLADALMFAGCYGEARATFDDALGDAGAAAHPEWKLKRHMLEWLITTTGFDVQARDPAGAEQLLVNDDLDVERLMAALQLDALHADALWRLGHHLRLTNQRSVDAFVSAALVSPHSVEAWAYAIAHAGMEEPEMLHDVASCARRHVGSEFLSELEVGDAPAEVVTYIEELFEHVGLDEGPPLEIRFAPTGSAAYELVGDREAAAPLSEE